MELTLTPLEFARRARKLYAHREAVVDGATRLSYGQFLDRCGRWSGTLQQLGVKQGDRVAIISPNTHAMLESFYSVPQLGAVVVPLNYRLTAADFAYMIQHSGARIVCAHADYLDTVDGIRAQLPAVQQFVALEGQRPGWLDYEALLAAGSPEFVRPRIAESDLLAINYTSGTTARPKGVMITHRNAWMNTVGTLLHYPVSAADRYLWTLPMFHANGWTFVWTVTAVGAMHVCLRKVDAATVYDHIRRECISALLRHPAVQEVAVVGVPDQKWGETPHAFVVLRHAATATATELHEFCRAHLAHFKVPREFSFIVELPKTATGKIQKFILRNRHSAISRQ